ncbi:MAG TPA: alginate export family protein, partial [Alphaproteobacteria bacterium]
TPLSTSLVNALELLQGYVAITAGGLIADGSKTEVKAGRLTLDMGSRRLVGRAGFRNTINAFTGIDARWTGAGGGKLRAFFTLPVDRRPNTRAALSDNRVAFDDESWSQRFWSVYYAEPELPWGDRGEVYLFGLDEYDSSRRATADRTLYTPGFRLYRPAAGGAFDYQVEAIVQFGESRASTAATDVAVLDHLAHFEHFEVGYSFATHWSPRLIAQYDYASGDDDPADGRNNRFDPLFGARRFDFGPTDIYGPFARSNLSSPGLRLEVKPAPGVDGMLAGRSFWLASDRDTWTGAGVRDATGASGGFLGTQVEARLRWQVVPGNLQLEAGYAHLFAGSFADRAPNATGEGDTDFAYGQMALTF